MLDADFSNTNNHISISAGFTRKNPIVVDPVVITENGTTNAPAGHAFNPVTVNVRGGEGTADHRELTNRDALNQHPISSITGLQNALDDKASTAYVDNAVLTKADISYVDNALGDKQDTISDLATIRSGASKGATSVQPSDLATVATSGSYNDLSNTPTDLADFSDDSTHRLVTDSEKSTWSGKQDTISDLSTIRTGSALGATAVQPAALSYYERKENRISTVNPSTDSIRTTNYYSASAVSNFIDKLIPHYVSAHSWNVGDYCTFNGNLYRCVTSHSNIQWDASKWLQITDFSLDVVTELLSAIPNIIDNITSTSTTMALSANQGKLLNDRINNLSQRGRFLSLWDCTTGLPLTNPSGYPYDYHTGDFFIVSAVGLTNYIPNGSSYTGVPSTTVYSGTIKQNDTIFYDGTSWIVLDTPGGGAEGSVQDVYVNNASVLSGGVAYVVVPDDLADLNADSTHRLVTDTEKSTWNAKQNAINDLATIRSGAELGATAVQPSDLAAVATSGSYNDLGNKPTIPTALSALSTDSTHRLVTDTEKSTWNNKQNAIDDLTTIRNGASAGASAVQPSAISDMATKTWVNAQGFLTQHQSLSNYYTKAQTDSAIQAKITYGTQDLTPGVSELETGTLYFVYE